MALGNAWHFPGNPEPFGNAGMRDPVFPTDPVSRPFQDRLKGFESRFVADVAM
jgi:hypothetical protein